MKSRHWAKLLGEAKEYVQDDTTRVPTGLRKVDRLLRGGLRPGHLALMIGRTGVGKTAVTMQVVVNSVTQGRKVAFASLEMGRSEMVIRAVSCHTHSSVEEAEGIVVRGENPMLTELANLTIDDTSKPGWDDLAVWCDELKGLDMYPDLVVVDHLGLMKRGWSKGEAERVNQLTEEAKIFAKSKGVAVLVVHQVGRFSEGDTRNHGHLPLNLTSAKYGGEQDADYVFGVYRPSMDPELTPAERQLKEKDVYLQVLKNRHGDQDIDGVYLKWHRPTFWFEETEQAPDYGV